MAGRRAAGPAKPAPTCLCFMKSCGKCAISASATTTTRSMPHAACHQLSERRVALHNKVGRTVPRSTFELSLWGFGLGLTGPLYGLASRYTWPSRGPLNTSQRRPHLEQTLAPAVDSAYASTFPSTSLCAPVTAITYFPLPLL